MSAKRSLFKKFLAGSVVFYILSGLTSLINYLFYPVIARFVNVAQYGEVQFLVSMFTQLSVGFVVLNILAVIVSVKLPDQEKQQEAISTLNSISQIAAFIIAGAGIAILVAARQKLSLSSDTPIILLGISLLANAPFTIVIGRLQGNGNFIMSGVISVVSVVIKLLTSLTLAIIGYGVSGVIGGIIVGLVVAWLLGEYIVHFGKKPSHLLHAFRHRLKLRDIAFLKHYAGAAFLAISVLTLLSSADSIISRIVLDSKSAGQYAAIATITKTLLAIVTPIMWLSLPPAVNGDTSIIRRYIGIAAIICGSVGAMIIAAPSFFTTTLIGVNPGDFRPLITPATISMTFCALAFLALAAVICMRKLRTSIVIALAGILIYVGSYLVLISILHEPLLVSLYSQILAALIMFLLSYRAIATAHIRK